MPLLSPSIGERLAGMQVGRGSLSRPGIAFIHDEDTGINWRNDGEYDFVSNGVRVGGVTADGITLPLFTSGSVLFAGTDGRISEDTGFTFNSTSDVLTLAGGLVSPTVGPAAAQLHTLPAVASDTVALIAAAQTLTNKTIALGSNTISGTTAQFNTALTDNDFATLAGVEVLTNKTLNLASNTLVATSAQLLTAVTDETGTGVLVFGTNPTITGPTLSGTVIGTYSIGGTPTLISALAMSGAPDFGTGLARAGTLFATVLDTSGNAIIGGEPTVNGSNILFGDDNAEKRVQFRSAGPTSRAFIAAGVGSSGEIRIGSEGNESIIFGTNPAAFTEWGRIISGAMVFGTTNTTNTASGDLRLLNALWIGDGVSVPTTTAGFAVIFVDTADGDLKVKFGDGTVKLIVTDT